jgi:hypothetical protein
MKISEKIQYHKNHFNHTNHGSDKKSHQNLVAIIKNYVSV